jgi:hypothetical protein
LFWVPQLDIQAMEYAPTELLGDRHLSSLGALTGLEALVCRCYPWGKTGHFSVFIGQGKKRHTGLQWFYPFGN